MVNFYVFFKLDLESLFIMVYIILLAKDGNCRF